MEISHINHASLLLENNGHTIFTDPWVNSVAFGGWSQLPKADIGLIKKATSCPNEKCLILISHGHDDHFDDEFIKENFPNSSIAIAKFKAPGVRFRAKAVTNAEVIEVDETGINWNGFKIRAYINPEYTGDDAIFTVADGTNFLVHANDNWHLQPEEIIADIARDAAKYESSRIAWCSQVGIAGSWPIFYEQVPFDQKTEIIKNSLLKMLQSGIKNAERIGAGYQYVYANQSSFINKVDYLEFYKRDRWIVEAISILRKNYNLHIEQLFPGSKLYSQNIDATSNPSFDLSEDLMLTSRKRYSYESGISMSSTDLKDFERECNEYLTSKLGGEALHVAFYEFESDDYLVAKTTSSWHGLLNIVARPEIWQQVLLGNLNMECMTIGGLCGIYKKNYDENLRDIHIALSNFGYKYQAQQRRKGKI